jgi:hypothetical protein
MPHALRTAILVLAGLASLACGEADRDRIERRNAATAVGWVVRETTDKIWYAPTRDGRPTALNAADVTRVLYRFQVGDGFWSKAVEARDRGRYADAAELFGGLAATGSREPEIVLGAFAEGEMWEQAGRYDAAARAYARISDNYGPRFPLPEPGKPPTKPKDDDLPHRLWLDARTRQGMALGLSGDVVAATVAVAVVVQDGETPPPPPPAPRPATAQGIADELLERGKRLSQPEADVRSAMVRAAIVAGKGDRVAFLDACKRVVLSPGETAYVHFQLFRADTLRRLGDVKAATQTYRALMPALGSDAAVAAQAEPQAALAEFAILDLLPAGSPDQKCVARYHVGRLLLAEAEAVAAAKPAQAADHRRAARMLLTAAAAADATRPEKAEAQRLLTGLGPDPDAPMAKP